MKVESAPYDMAFLLLLGSRSGSDSVLVSLEGVVGPSSPPAKKKEDKLVVTAIQKLQATIWKLRLKKGSQGSIKYKK